MPPIASSGVTSAFASEAPGTPAGMRQEEAQSSTPRADGMARGADAAARQALARQALRHGPRPQDRHIACRFQALSPAGAIGWAAGLAESRARRQCISAGRSPMHDAAERQAAHPGGGSGIRGVCQPTRPGTARWRPCGAWYRALAWMPRPGPAKAPAARGIGSRWQPRESGPLRALLRWDERQQRGRRALRARGHASQPEAGDTCGSRLQRRAKLADRNLTAIAQSCRLASRVRSSAKVLTTARRPRASR